MTDKPLSRDEMIEILEEIARDPDAYPSARITAIRTLRAWADDEENLIQPDDDLYPDQLAARRNRRSWPRR